MRIKFTRTLVWHGSYSNGKAPRVPCPPATNGIIVQVRPARRAS